MNRINSKNKKFQQSDESSTDYSFKKVYSKILNLLGKSAISEYTAQTKLDYYLSKEDIEAGEREKIKKDLMRLLKEQKLVDDDKYTRDFIDSLLNSSKPRSRNQILKMLYSKKVPPSIIKQYTGKISTKNQTEAVRKILEKKLKNIKKPLSYKEKAKLIGYLKNKGFDFEVIKDVVDTTDGVK